MSSESFPTDDGLKMMRYLLSIWIFKICEVYPMTYVEENTFQPINEKYYLLTMREKDILDQSSSLSSSSSSSSERCGLRAQLLLSWVQGYFFSPKLALCPSTFSILHSLYLNYCSSLPSRLSPTISVVLVSLTSSSLLLHGYLLILALYLAISHLYSTVNVLQELFTVSFLTLICLLFSSFYLTLHSLQPRYPHNHFSFPLLTQWKEIIHLCRHILAFTSQKESSDELWYYNDRIWTEEELERSRPFLLMISLNVLFV